MSPECRHIRVTGHRCGSPAMRDQAYCYFHARSRTRHQPPASDNLTLTHPLITDDLGHAIPMLLPTGQPVFDFPPIEDRESIQVAVSMIVNALGRNILEPKRAASMLYALQVATAVTRLNDDGVSDYFVETETVLSPDGTDLAPDEAA